MTTTTMMMVSNGGQGHHYPPPVENEISAKTLLVGGIYSITQQILMPQVHSDLIGNILRFFCISSVICDQIVTKYDFLDLI